MEEDIKILEEFLETAKIHTSIIPDINFEPFYKEQQQALENLLKRYRELEEKETEKFLKILEDNSKITLVKEVMELRKENEQYKKQFEDIKCNILVPSITEKNFIPISVIENKIDEYREENRKLYNEEGIIVNERMVKNKLRAEVLQELLDLRSDT